MFFKIAVLKNFANLGERSKTNFPLQILEFFISFLMINNLGLALTLIFFGLKGLIPLIPLQN